MIDDVASKSTMRLNKKKAPRFSFANAVIFFFIVSNQAVSSDITFKPINPSFGGNPFYDGHLLATANVQNKYTAKREERDLSEQRAEKLRLPKEPQGQS